MSIINNPNTSIMPTLTSLGDPSWMYGLTPLGDPSWMYGQQAVVQPSPYHEDVRLRKVANGWLITMPCIPGTQAATYVAKDLTEAVDIINVHLVKGELNKAK